MPVLAPGFGTPRSAEICCGRRAWWLMAHLVVRGMDGAAAEYLSTRLVLRTRAADDW